MTTIAAKDETVEKFEILRAPRRIEMGIWLVKQKQRLLPRREFEQTENQQ